MSLKLKIRNFLKYFYSFNYFTFISFQSQGAVNPIEMLQPIVFVFWSFIFIFIFCNFGEMFTKNFNEVNYAMAECDWYQFPIDIQRHLPIILINTQQTVMLQGFGNIDLSRDTFKRVSVIKRQTFLTLKSEYTLKLYSYFSHRLSTADFHIS